MVKLSEVGRPGRTMAVLGVAVLVLACLGGPLIPQKASAVNVSDNFNRPDGGLGSNWTTVGGTFPPVIAGNQMTPGTVNAFNSAYWSANSFSSDQFAQGNFPTAVTPGNYGPGIAVRLADTRGYFLWYGNSDNTVSLWRMDNGSTTQELASSGTLTIAPSDTWRIEADGAVLTGYQNGTQVVQATDGTYSGGSPGVWLYSANDQVDNWSGGDMPAQYGVGGKVAGLDGTVVLQNNGGGDLNVGNNGVFTFNTPLTTGVAYNVTVLTNPAGQTCSVANGSGTMGTAAVSNISVSCTGSPPSASGSDNFNRANGALGSGWSDYSDGALTISGNEVLGTNGLGGGSGDYRVAESYPSNQYSQIEISATPLSGGDWVGPTVRAQNGGLDEYLALYDWNNGSGQYVQLFKRQSGGWTGLTGPITTGQLAAGAKLKIMAVGSTIALMIDGVEKVAVYDNSITGGAPGINAFGVPKADNWSGGGAGFEVHYLSTDANGVESYDMISDKNGYGPQVLRILRPSSPAPGVPHNIIFALPVEAGLGTGFGDGLETMRTANAQNQYNLTIVAPAFGLEPWYADNPNDSNAQQESFLTAQLWPWVQQNLKTTGYEQNWLIGFSKSGMGATTMILKHPDLFDLAATWDFPSLNFTSYSDYGASSQNSYGTEANFQANYRLTNAFMEAHKAPFQGASRLWIGGYNAFQNDVAAYGGELTDLGIPYLTEAPTFIPHAWDSGWVPVALAALAQNGADLPDTTAPTVTAFSAASSGSSLTAPVTAFTAKDNKAVTGYMLTESAGAPSPGAAGWTGSAPAAYTFASGGSKTLYAWAKDAAGNVSVALSASVSVTSPPSSTGGGQSQPKAPVKTAGSQEPIGTPVATDSPALSATPSPSESPSQTATPGHTFTPAPQTSVVPDNSASPGTSVLAYAAYAIGGLVVLIVIGAAVSIGIIRRRRRNFMPNVTP